MRPDHSAPAIVLVLALVSCAGRAEDSSTAALPWATGEPWSLQQIWSTAGAAEGPYAFRGPVVVSLGPDGHVYVADSQAADIKVFTRNGDYLRSIASDGGAGMVSAGWSPTGAFWVVASGQAEAGGGYKLFDSEGALRAQHPRVIARMPRRTQPAIFHADGQLIDVGSGLNRGGGIAIKFELIDSLGTKVGELEPLLDRPHFPLPRGVIVGGSSAFDPNDFRSHLVYRPLPDGSVWFAESSSLTLYLRSPSGDTVRVIRTSHRDDTLTPDQQRDIDAWVAATGREAEEVVVGPAVVQAIHVLDDGHVLVQTPAIGDRDRSSFEVFDGSGSYLGSVALGFTLDPASVSAFQGDTLFAAARDELDARYLTRATLVRDR